MKTLRKSFSLTGIILLLIFTPFISVKSVVFEPTDKNVITLNGDWDFYITFEEDNLFILVFTGKILNQTCGKIFRFH